MDLADEPAVFATRILADLGADVIRVEHPSGGRLRSLAPFVDDEPGIERSLYHLYHNANKRSVTLDITEPAGREIFKKLVTTTDVLVETGAPGHMASHGLGYSDLAAVNSGLIYVSVTPHGQGGPWKDRNGTDLTAAASSGLLFVAGQTDDPPTVAGGDQSYKMASLASAAGVLIALVGRRPDPSGKGAHLDISIQEAASMAVAQTSNANHFTWRGDIPQRPGMTRGVFRCTDGGWVTLNLSADRLKAFLGWLEESGIETDMAESLHERSGGLTLLPEVLELTAKLAGRHTRKEFMDKAWELDMLSLPLQDFPDLAVSEHLRVTNQFFEVWSEALDAPLGFTRSPVDVFPTQTAITPAPVLGAHNIDVFGELGMSAGEIEELHPEVARGR